MTWNLAVATEDLERLVGALGDEFTIERFPHNLDLSAVASDLRVQFQWDPRYARFVSRAERRLVLGLELVNHKKGTVPFSAAAYRVDRAVSQNLRHRAHEAKVS